MKKINITLIFCFLILVSSCVNSLDDYNVDQKNATAVPAVTLFTNAVKELSDALMTPNVNVNNYRFYAQHWTSTQYLDEPRYNMTSRLIPQNMWDRLYRNTLMDLQESKRVLSADNLLAEDIKNNQMAQIGIMEVYAWSVVVNTFGNAPYTEALNPDITLPKYDDAQTIYNDILSRLDQSLDMITVDADGFDDGDLFYEGDMAKWLKFGNSLKLKLAMVIADSDAAQAQTLVEEAATNVFTSNEDNAAFPYMGAEPNNNPVSSNVKGQYSTREDYVAASTLVDAMNDRNDPRRIQYFSQVDGEFIGGEYGFANSYSDFSTVSEKIANPTQEGVLLDYAETSFLLAEAAERGYNVSGTAEEHYTNAVTASITYWGGTAADANAYLAQSSVDYSSASGDWKEVIGTQKWIALYNRGYDAWLEWRRLDAPNLQPPQVEGASALVIPLRLIYPVNEQTLNGANRAEAAEAIGGDEGKTALFWDVN
ncbi:SusD/RagB family nutrient-binding outer membrane lipoprotein [Echinicola strongylocentroti]|uniref:SusD/RagB family nutrient-binding outer membrane lipoprotein n=1 Tax=Echinicola strongylocentroti TaxID=1795355 RepID=A0A2Z4IIG0_9BACT|nr:SusD/RagB family nutrient-binding outer membrane lipoprotein [Echinicola strongylocentroti]AWW30480.1 SusD/RagB family nutrient-binding outer membrane lipoprotein [Echinicola strongylocentroti]